MNANRVKRFLPLIAMLLIGVGITYAVYTVTQQVTGQGHIVAVNDVSLYLDPECTQPFTTWSPQGISRDSSNIIEQTFYAKNNGDFPMDLTWAVTQSLPLG